MKKNSRQTSRAFAARCLNDCTRIKLMNNNSEMCSLWKLNILPTLHCKFCLSFNRLVPIICYAGIHPHILFHNFTDHQTASRKKQKPFGAVQNRTVGVNWWTNGFTWTKWFKNLFKFTEKHIQVLCIKWLNELKRSHTVFLSAIYQEYSQRRILNEIVTFHVLASDFTLR